MKTLICHEPNSIEYIERDVPTIQETEVLLKVNAVGICGTDIHAYAGRQPFFSYPRVLGHEISGTAVKRQFPPAAAERRHTAITVLQPHQPDDCPQSRRADTRVLPLEAV